MDTGMVFNLQSVCSLFMFGLVAKWFVWPKLMTMPRSAALVPLLVYSAFRYMGTFFMVPEITNNLSMVWGTAAAYLDLLSVTIALIAAFLLHAKKEAGIPIAWLYGVVGFLAFAHGASQLQAMDVAAHIGAAMPVMTILGPSWMVTIFVIFLVLIKHPNNVK